MRWAGRAVVVGAWLVVLIVADGQSAHGVVASGMSHLRFVNALNGDRALQLIVNGARVLEPQAAHGISDYVALVPGSYRVQVRMLDGNVADAVADTSSPLIDLALLLRDGEERTLVLTEHNGRLQPLLLRDDNVWPDVAVYRLRLVNLAQTDTVDLNMASQAQIFHAVPPLAHTDYLTQGAGVWSGQLVESSNASGLLTLNPIKLYGGSVYTAFVFEERGHFSIGISIDAQRPLLPETGGDLTGGDQ